MGARRQIHRERGRVRGMSPSEREGGPLGEGGGAVGEGIRGGGSMRTSQRISPKPKSCGLCGVLAAL